ncbi:MAG: hypothetical protein GX306_09485 [Clostridiales bacterium]|jgi:hypothetical protein|nr:hypothetical protein [Clostridiales bacterium]
MKERKVKESGRKITKTERQLYLYEIFYRCLIVEINEITRIIPAGKKMIERDIKDLTDAGLINVKYSPVNRGYIKNGEPLELNVAASTDRRVAHLIRLNRLGTLMFNLEFKETPAWEMIGVEDEDYFHDNEDQVSCISAYKELFPTTSERTRQRDFKTLCNIGYTVKYDNQEKYYYKDFPESFREDFGLVKGKDGIYCIEI